MGIDVRLPTAEELRAAAMRVMRTLERFEPRVVDVSARFPAVVEEAPDGYLYVIDQGDENVIGGLQGQAALE